MHIPVLLKEVLEALNVQAGGAYIDGTLGGAGHASEILLRTGETGRLLGIDRDPDALQRAGTRLADLPGEVVLVHGVHGEIGKLAENNGFSEVDGILLDLGVSSDQLDTAGRGFSFRLDGPLDMRMDPSCGESAAGLLARVGEVELRELLWKWGEEPRARQVASAIVKAREKCPIETTGRLAEIVERAVGGRRGGKNPATRTFQALRMAVNDEMGNLERALGSGLRLLRPGGRFAVITFESLTDRMVKQTFARHIGKWVSLLQGGQRWEGELPAVTKVTRHPIEPSASECALNPRARSAKLRVVERVGE